MINKWYQINNVYHNYKQIIKKHLKKYIYIYNTNRMKNNISRQEDRRVVKLWIMADRYNATTPFGKKRKEVPPPPPPEPWRYVRPERCRSMKNRRLTSWRGSTGTMEIVALRGSTLLLLWSFQAFILSFIPNLFHSKTVDLRSCPSRASHSVSFQQASSQKVLTVPPAP